MQLAVNVIGLSEQPLKGRHSHYKQHQDRALERVNKYCFDASFVLISLHVGGSSGAGMRHSDFAIAVKATGEVVRSPAKNDLIVREKALPGKSCRKNGRKSTFTETAVSGGEGKVMRSRTGQI